MMSPRLTTAIVVASLLAVLAVAQQPGRSPLETAIQAAETLRKDGKLTEAIRQYEKALQIAKKTPGKDGREAEAVIQNNLGTINQQLGDLDESEKHYLLSRSVRQDAGLADSPRDALTVASLAELYRLTGQYDRAAPFYQLGLQRAQKLHGRASVEAARAQLNLALLHETTGRYDLAGPLYSESLRIFQAGLEPNRPEIAEVNNHLGRLYQQTGQYDLARPCFEQCLAIREKRRDTRPHELAQAVNNLGDLARLQKRPAEAERHHRRSQDVLEKAPAGPDPARTQLELARTLNSLALLEEEAERFAQAEQHLERSLAIRKEVLKDDHPTVGLALNNLATLHLAMNRLDEAAAMYPRAQALFEKRLGPEHPHVALTLSNLALLQAARERWDDALATTDRARRILRRHASRILPSLAEPEQLAFLQSQHQPSLHQALSLGLLRRRDPEAAARSAEWVLNGKAIAQQALAERTLLGRDGNDSDVGETVRNLISTRTRLATLTLQSPPAGQEEAFRKQVARLTTQELELNRKLGGSAGRADRPDPWVGLEEVRRAIPAGAVLIELARFRVRDFTARGSARAWKEAHYAAWVIPARGAGKIQVLDLGPAGAIEKAVQAVRQVLNEAPTAIPQRGEAASEAALRRSMEEVAKLLLQPLREAVGPATTWFLSPDAELWLVPWAALPLADGSYAVEKYTFRSVVSGRDLVAPPQTARTTKPLVMADPDYDLKPAGRATTPSTTVPPALQIGPVRRLEGTAKEARAIRQPLHDYTGEEPETLTRGKATEAAFKAARRPRVVVLSTHGFFLEDTGTATTRPRGPLDNPLLRCGLLLAGANERESARGAGVEDGVLTGLEIIGCDLRGTELVILSACETGTGKVNQGEGVAGLRQAFQLAGARSVVGSLWNVEDTATAQLMIDFVTGLAAGKDRAEALRDAQIALVKSRRAGKNGVAHPFFWAAFTLTGP